MLDTFSEKVRAHAFEYLLTIRDALHALCTKRESFCLKKNWELPIQVQPKIGPSMILESLQFANSKYHATAAIKKFSTEFRRTR